MSGITSTRIDIPLDTFSPPPPIEAYDVEGKVVVIRVNDPTHYDATQITKCLHDAGAGLVLVARPEDKLEFLNDGELAMLGLQRAPKPKSKKAPKKSNA